MITYYNSFTYHLFCLSSDEKPDLKRKDANGTFLLEIDTGKRFCWDYESRSWLEQPSSGSGSGASYKAGTGIDITNGEISLDVDSAKEALSVLDEDDVKAILADSSDKAIKATSLSVLEDGEEVSVATVNKVVTKDKDGSTFTENYIFTEI